MAEGDVQRGIDWTPKNDPVAYQQQVEESAKGQSFKDKFVANQTPASGVAFQGDPALSLAAARKFDPNAKLTSTWVPGTANNSETGGQSGGYWSNAIDYDQSKVPQIGAGWGLTKDQQSNLIGVPGNTKEEAAKHFKYLRDPNAFKFDPNYGWVTDKRNIIEKEGTDWIGILGPMLVGGFAGLAGAGAGLSQAMAGFNAVKGVASGGSALGAGLGFLGGLTGIPGLGAAGSIVGSKLSPSKAPSAPSPTSQLIQASGGQGNLGTQRSTQQMSPQMQQLLKTPQGRQLLKLILSRG